ncbi:MAG TPA: hypothetical protein VEA69_05605 [Tepidisphaeraceae bacterium]|nr:hypothetical protein [Tepidisphaeraceae bacterium]
MTKPRFALTVAMTFSFALLVAVGGCQTKPQILTGQKPIDRAVVEYPPGFELRPYVAGLTAPTAIAFDAEGSLLIAESGMGGDEPRIFGFKKDGTYFDVYPRGTRLPAFLSRAFRMEGPVGGMVATGGRVYVTHRDAAGKGRVTAISYDGKVDPKTIVADLPTRGDYGMTDVALHPNGRLYFGVGAATNSGVVGLDNLQAGWAKQFPDFCDVPYADVKLNGFRFDTTNPFASIFGGKDVAVTGPFQKFGASDQTGIPRPDGKPTAAVYSVDQAGGDLKVEAHGVRNPVGLTFNEYGTLYMTNQGMELRGSRPVMDDNDAFLKMAGGETWYGWPDFSADLRPITERAAGAERGTFQPPRELVLRSGYPDVRFLIDHAASRLIPPTPGAFVFGTFRPLSGASKFDFAPSSGPFRKFRGDAMVALSGDRAPFATSGYPMKGPTGYKVVLVNIDGRNVEDFVRNTQEGPASRRGRDAAGLERPVDVKFGPDGAMYILDFGQLQMKNGRADVKGGTGRIFRLSGTEAEAASAAPETPGGAAPERSK